MAKRKPQTVSEQLKGAIRSDPRSVYAIAKAAGLAPIVVSRFLTGEREIKTSTMGKLCDVLNLELRPKSKQIA